MSEPKFTPGPWHVGHGHGIQTAMEGWTYYPVCWSKDDENVCDIVYNKADADLIAAAPEMYEELEKFVELCYENDCGDYARRAEEILKKARGESEDGE